MRNKKHEKMNGTQDPNYSAGHVVNQAYYRRGMDASCGNIGRADAASAPRKEQAALVFALGLRFRHAAVLTRSKPVASPGCVGDNG
jgi:hypothetical protein